MIENKCENRGQHCEDMRAAFEHRATWFYTLINEARKKGLDYDFAREAILACGRFHGDHKYTKTDDLMVFAPEFANQNVVDIFEMEVLKADDQNLDIDFHYCPLVNAWKKLGVPEDEIATLCDIAMDGDRGIISTFPKFRFELGETIAKGDKVCQIRISKTAE